MTATMLQKNDVTIKAFDMLLNEHFIHPKVSPSGIKRYCVYDIQRNPKLILSAASYRKIDNMLRKQKGVMVLNKTYVRGMHKNSLFYKRYKQEYEIRKGTSRI